MNEFVKKYGSIKAWLMLLAMMLGSLLLALGWLITELMILIGSLGSWLRYKASGHLGIIPDVADAKYSHGNRKDTPNE